MGNNKDTGGYIPAQHNTQPTIANSSRHGKVTGGKNTFQVDKTIISRLKTQPTHDSTDATTTY
ncbi:hypothetical protein EON65_50860 [archaeon]|nr:MAG: hypothetical protein EON65_50860 [archaeon]